MVQYNIGSFDDVTEFLAQISRRIGKMKKGAVPDTNAAAKKVNSSLRFGKKWICFYKKNCL